MDGVLVDSEHLYRQMNLKLFAELGATVSQELYNSFIGISATKMWTILKDRFGIREAIPVLKTMEKDRKYQMLSEYELDSFDGIADLLVEAKQKGYKMAIASSSPKKNIELVAQKLGITDFFQVLLSGEEVTNGKPAPDIFLQAAKLLGADTTDCLVIEDSRNGALAAQAAEIACVGFRSPHSGNQDLSTCQLVVDSFDRSSRQQLFQLIE